VPAFLFVCQPEKLDEPQQKELALIRQTSPSAETAYGLAQAFMQMIREHTGEQLDTWIHSVEASHLPELESFAKGIQQDKAAVCAGLTWPYSNGPLEGQVNRLKLIKRSMYGRAKLPQLASTCASCGREGAFSRSHPCWRVMCLTSRGKQVQEG
jgi:transposase